ncbi:MAG: type II secretion system F family protein [Ruminococcus sp.]|nr:type II secretion system F family protein [Ruminococcus sp.]
MKKFSYTAKDVRGIQSKGVIVASDEKEFMAKMREKGLFVITSKESDSNDAKTTHKFNTKELAFNCRQLSAMLSSGLTLVKALDILCREQEKESAKVIWRDVYENVQKGESFSASLEMHEGSFPQFLTSMVAAGESSGSLDVIMKRMSDHYAKENKLHNVIKSAMVYPVILLVLTVVIVIGLFAFIMPTFLDMYENPDDMPGLTKVLKAVSNFITKRWYVLIIVTLLLIFGIIYALKVPSLRLKIDRMLIKGPGFGPLIVKVYTGRFSRTLSSLYSSGIPMVECLERSSAILGNSYIDQCFENVIDEVKQGETLSSAIQRTEIFDSMFCSIIYVGEESGALDDILEKTSDYYEEESESAIQRLVGMLEPVLIIVLGVVIGLVVAGVYPALYGSFESIENE